jgi:hypothetical protein
MKKLLLSLTLLGTAAVFAQQYSIDWHKVAGGGGSSSGGQYQLSGTIGQHDATTAMSGGNYSLTGGFWAISAIQTVGAPTLYISQSGNNVILSWVAPSTGFLLENNSNLNVTNGWSTVLPSPVTSNGFNYVTNTITPGNKFYRLHHPYP